MSSHIMPTYARLPVTFVKGQGAWLWDQQNKRYLDALSGIAVCNLGHAHEAVHQAISEQSRTLLHTSNLYGIDKQQQLADKLAVLSGLDNIFFCNSGAEANEAALKIARRYGHQKNIDTPVVLCMNSSFHGRTLATLSATGNPKVQADFEPLVEGFIHVPFNNIAAIETAIAENDNIVAVLVEPVQGEGGVNIPDDDYLPTIRALCDQHQLLMMLDEIQTGIGRCGRFFAFQRYDFKPDVMTLAKALGNGVPIGACLARGIAAEMLSAGKHGSTFGGNPLACSAALAVIDTLSNSDLIEQAEQKGQKICRLLTEKTADANNIRNIRHQGLMIGIDLAEANPTLVQSAMEIGLLINVTAEKTIRLLPPLIIDDEQIELLTDGLATLLKTQ